MGMFDKPKYLTGKEDSYAEEGDVFYLHNARLEGQVDLGNGPQDQAKLLVSRDGERENAEVVFTSGRGIANQVARMSEEDKRALPIQVRLDLLPASQPGRNGTYVLNPADAPAVGSAEDIPF